VLNRTISTKRTGSWVHLPFWLAALGITAVLGLNVPISANHPVLVEGEQTFDGDANFGIAEDNDGDLVFGTINTALAAALGAANQNGRVTIVTSGRFGEVVVINAANGNVTLEAAPGVEANIDAVITGARANEFPGTNATRQAAPGIVVNAINLSHVVIRNIVSRNWTEGIIVTGDSRVTIDKCRIEYNVNRGILVQGNARVSVIDTQVNATGFRVGATGQAPFARPGNPAPVITPAPGSGIDFQGGTGVVANSTVTGSFAGGVVNAVGSALRLVNVVTFDNNPDISGSGGSSCAGCTPPVPSPGPGFVPNTSCTGWVPVGHPDACPL
jgi:hypothetical protein